LGAKVRMNGNYWNKATKHYLKNNITVFVQFETGKKRQNIDKKNDWILSMLTIVMQTKSINGKK
jgi:hypothetical protein